jgi:hypothetical protein
VRQYGRQIAAAGLRAADPATGAMGGRQVAFSRQRRRRGEKRE